MQSSRLHTVLSVLVVCITLALGWLSQRVDQGIDLTANSRNSLSDTSKSVLRAIKTPVEIIAVIGPDQPQREAIATLVSRLQTIKPDIQLQFINPETDPAAARALNVTSGGELILRTAGRERRLTNLSERSITSSLRHLNREEDRAIAFLTGHDERSPTRISNQDWSTVASRLDAIGLVSRELSLVSEPYIDDSIDLVVIAAPRRTYFPGEVASLNSYLNRGGNLLWLSEGNSNATSGPGLQLLADTLGVDTLPGVVIDTNSQALAADSPDFVMLDRFPSHPITQTLASPVLLPQAAALAVTPLAGQTTLPLLQTPTSSWTETGALSGSISFDEKTTEVAGPLLLGVTIERPLTQGTQRIAVIGDADFGSSQFIDNGGNQKFIEALMLWLTGEFNTLDFGTQSAIDSTLTLSNNAVVLLSVTYLAGLPILLLLIAGLVRWRRGSH
ncbi:MAG: hypothetical protein ACI8VW_002061 [bacterium]|jgi:hypothetical protein